MPHQATSAAHRKRLGKDRRVQRRLHRHQHGVRQRTHRPANRIVDLTMRLVGQAEERRGGRVLLLGCRQAGGDKESLYCVNGDPLRLGVVDQALRQPVLGFVQLALPERSLR